MGSFRNVLNFIGQSISEEPEYAVGKHPRTPNVRENPVHTMALLVNRDEPETSDISIQVGDWYYALKQETGNRKQETGNRKQETGYQWNREGFRLLCQIFQMTMTDLAQQASPAITISK